MRTSGCGVCQACVDRGGPQQDAALQDLGFTGAADRGGGAGDKPRQPAPCGFEGVGNGAGADVAGASCEPVDEFAPDAMLIELHAGEANDSRSGLVRHHEVDVAAGQACIGKRLGDSGRHRSRRDLGDRHAVERIDQPLVGVDCEDSPVNGTSATVFRPMSDS